MPSLKDLRARIASVKSTRKITKAMQLVAASKLKKAQDAAEASRPYALRMASVIANLSASVVDGQGPMLLTGSGKDETHLLVVMTAERGLCGGFNTQIVRKAMRTIGELKKAGKTVKIITVGRKGRDQLKRLYSSMLIDHIDLRGAREITGSIAADIAQAIMTRYEAGEFDVCSLVYSEFKNVLTQTPIAQQFIPASGGEDVEEIDLGGALYIYEPNEIEILETLLPQYLSTQVLSALLENAAGEQGARMTAMDNATRNAGDLINRLTISYNRQRQAQITKELIEIISGAEAL